MQVDLITKI